MVDIEKLEDLPYRENKKIHLTNKYGNMWEIFDYKEHPHKEKNPYVIVQRVLKANIGKSFKMAFSYYCKKVSKQYQYLFLDEFEKKNRYYNLKWDYYYIDENENIQLKKPSYKFFKHKDRFENNSDRMKAFAEKKKADKKKKKSKITILEIDFRAILRAKQLKQKEETRIKLEAKGFRKNAFTNHV